ncbi:MAG: hypothetical protein U0174_11535 [Polyangiaceae bacterium]
MTKTKWLHFGLIGCALGGFAALAACSSNDIVDPGVDSGVQQDSGIIEPPDTGVADAGPDAAKLPAPKIGLIHAATQLGPVKLCLAAKQTGIPDPKTEIFPTKILPTTIPAIPHGAYAVLPFKSIDASTYNLIAIAIKPQAVARISQLKGAVPECGDFMKDAVLEPTASGTDNNGVLAVENKDFWLIPNIAAGTFAQGKSYLAAVTGCPKGLDVAQGAKCGPNYDTSKGNLRIVSYEYDTTTKAGANNGVQFYHLAQDSDPVVGLGGAVDPTVKAFVNPSPTGGSDAGQADGRTYLNTTGVSYANTVGTGKGTPAPALVTTAPITLASKFGLTGVAGGNDLVNMSVALWAGAAVGGTPPADYFKPGENYAFIAVGDASQQNTIPLADGGSATNYNAFRIVAVPMTNIVVGDPGAF